LRVTVLQGTTRVQFFATVSNPSLTDTVYLNFDQTSASTGLTIDDSLFALNAPLFLSPGASSGPFEIFDAMLSTNLAAGLYTGTFTILGGPDGGTFTAGDDLADLNFSVTVTTPSTATPEPRTMVLLLCAFSLWGLLQVWFARINA
jgi:hypothetical protein